MSEDGIEARLSRLEQAVKELVRLHQKVNPHHDTALCCTAELAERQISEMSAALADQVAKSKALLKMAHGAYPSSGDWPRHAPEEESE